MAGVGVIENWLPLLVFAEIPEPVAARRDYASALREAGLPLSRFESLKFADDSHEAQSIEALLDEISRHTLKSALAYVIWGGENRQAFFGALTLIKAGMLQSSILEETTGLPWLDELIFLGKEPAAVIGGISLAERFGLLADAARWPGGVEACLQHAFFAAIRAGRADKIAPLHEAGASPDGGGERETTPLCFAVSHAKKAVLRPLVQAGANPNLAGPDGLTPLTLAARQGATECIRELKKLGADLAHADGRGMVALEHAIEVAHLESLRTLLSLGANVNRPNRAGDTPLHRAARIDEPDTLVILLHAGANPLAVNRQGETPLHLAAEAGALTRVQILAHAAPAAVAMRDREGLTPAKRALSCAHPMVARLLAKFGVPTPAHANAALVEIGDSIDPNLQF
ncbi:MAG: hypothetical protein RIR70_1601 [Pseudomonadota bacterium]